uniref:Uncharacterized protein n=1 Tax=Ascaris lumbricoides TaxID=6252 RepID=A0A0M3I6U0_ASCLU
MFVFDLRCHVSDRGLQARNRDVDEANRNAESTPCQSKPVEVGATSTSPAPGNLSISSIRQLRASAFTHQLYSSFDTV